MLERLGEMSKPVRADTIALYESGDPEKQSVAKTRAASVPPMPDIRIADLVEAVKWLKLAAKRRDDQHSAELGMLREAASKVLDKIRSEYQEFKKQEMSL
jgi:hypothetical protein